VNGLFHALVTYAHSNTSLSELTAVEQAEVRHLSARGEAALEMTWSHICTSAADPQHAIQKFPYYQNYRALVAGEWSLLNACRTHTNHTSVLFVGGGPLPLSAIILAQEWSVSVTVIDHDHEAIVAATALIATLGLSHRITITHADAFTYTNYAAFPVVYLAAMVGVSPTDKQVLLAYVREQVLPSTHVMIRSVWGSRTLLYEPVPAAALRGWQTLRAWRPAAPLINSALVLQPIA
jgi:nicotianamine synthase